MGTYERVDILTIAYDVAGPLFEGKEIWCDKCHTWNVAEKWDPIEPLCEDCGSHAGVLCPECDAVYDHVYDEDLRVRSAQPAESNESV